MARQRDLDSIGAAGRERPDPPDPDLFPSRAAGRDTLRAALLAGRGPALLTGEPGVGKTALWRSLHDERAVGDHWLGVEASPGTGIDALYRQIGHGLRVDRARFFDRNELRDLLAERSIDAARWTLVVDEAQNLDADALEEVRILSNRLGEPDGFAAILIVAQTPLAHRLGQRTLTGLLARLAAHVHLRPLDADEVGRLLAAAHPERSWPVDLVDRIHLHGGGIPSRVLAIAESMGQKNPLTRTVPETGAVQPPGRLVEAKEAAVPAWDGPLIGPSKPPIRVEDGLIEVGWDDDADEPGAIEGEFPTTTDDFTREGTAVEERITDHYAALQAWQEWATNQGRHPEIDPTAAAAPVDDEASPLSESPNVWVDEEHGFAPFGRLFSRRTQENEAD